MDMIKSFLLIFLLMIQFAIFAQDKEVSVTIVQEEKMTVEVWGVKKTSAGFLLANTLIVTGGSPEYFYQWSPEKNLDNPKLPRPTADSDEIAIYQLTVTDQRQCTCKANLDMSNIVGIAPIESQTFSIYPNPATEELRITFPEPVNNAEIRLYNLAGKLVNSTWIVDNNISTYSLPVSSYPRGIYIIQICASDKVNIQRIILN